MFSFPTSCEVAPLQEAPVSPSSIFQYSVRSPFPKGVCNSHASFFRDKFEVVEMESNIMLLKDVLKAREMGVTIAYARVF
jgi:hypothetical protein